MFSTYRLLCTDWKLTKGRILGRGRTDRMQVNTEKFKAQAVVVRSAVAKVKPYTSLPDDMFHLSLTPERAENAEKCS